jgi:hypothetical protein
MAKEGVRVRRVSQVLEVTPKTVYEWLRGKGPLHPDHVKARLGRKLDELTAGEPGRVEPPSEQSKTPTRGPSDPFFPDAAADRLARLPARYRERYQNRIREIVGWIERELSEYLKHLESEYRPSKGKKSRPEP